jgi:phage gpG-like protein
MADIQLIHNPLNNIRILLDEIGETWVSRIQKYFEISGPEEDKWAETQKPQKAAIIQKLRKEGSSVKAAMLNKYFDEEKKPLVDSGTLSNSFTYTVEQKEKHKYQLRVGTNISYAEKHHRGEKDSIPIDDQTKTAMKMLLKKDPKKYGFLKAFLSKDSYEIQLQRRVLIMWDKFLESQLTLIFNDFFAKSNNERKKKD